MTHRKHPVTANARVWLDEDGRHVWFSHDCTTERVETMLPYPLWSADPATGDVRPSIDCRECGTHSYFNLSTDAPCMCPWCSSERLTYCILTQGLPDHPDHRLPTCPSSVIPPEASDR